MKFSRLLTLFTLLLTLGLHAEENSLSTKDRCAQGDAMACHDYARQLLAEKKNTSTQEALSLFNKNCDNDFFQSCYDVGMQLRRTGQNEGARKAFRKICANSPLMEGCKELGGVSGNSAPKQELKTACIDGSTWACYALGYAHLRMNELVPAKTLFMEQCKKDLINGARFCEEAEKLIKLPPDVKEYVKKQKDCAHWGGESPYDAERAKDIAEGVARDCVDRSSDYNDLVKKYSTNKDILFVLEINQGGR